jgi:hypothetical protein
MVFLQKDLNYLTDYRASSILHRFLLKFDKSIKVILPVNICPIVNEVISKSGFTPHFIDVSEKYLFTIDQEKLIDYLNKNVGKKNIVLLNQTYGINFDFSKLCENLKKNYDVVIIEDKCLSIPNLETADYVDITLYSTGYAKILELPFGGGIAVSKDEIKLPEPLFYFGTSKEYKRMNIDYFEKEIQNKLSIVLEHKNNINDIYDSELKEYSINENLNLWRYNITVKNKDAVLAKIFENKLFASNHYKPLLSNYYIYKNSWDLYNNVINLFNDFYINEAQAYLITKIILEHDTI